MKSSAMKSDFNFGDSKKRVPLRMQYLGSKARISNWILHEIKNSLPDADSFVDAFAGTGVVGAAAAKRGYKLFANDIQPYSYCILQSMFAQPTKGVNKAIADLESIANISVSSIFGPVIAAYAKEEDDFFAESRDNKLNWKQYKSFCERTPIVTPTKEFILSKTAEKTYDLFVTYYANTYFGVRQCIQLDLLRKMASQYSENVTFHIIAATLAAMTYAVSSTTHLAQYLKPSSASTTQNLINKRSINIISDVVTRLKGISKTKPTTLSSCIHNSDFRVALCSIKPGPNHVIYVDPPYFKEHYSRYYHVLDTFCLYDYPMLTYNPRTDAVTSGRYREGRIVSEFGLKSSVKKAFADLFKLGASHKTNIVISYAETSLAGKSELLALANASGYKADIKEISIIHSGQGQPRHNLVKEFLFICTL
ncbi:MAG: DNA adenine methylase [Desulfobulbus sp.]|nr:DNA adenine methylase [Desulfobulbus sp.]